MARSRRAVLFALSASALAARTQFPDEPRQERRPRNPDAEFDPKLPNGKSQKDEIAKAEHEKALKDADELIDMAQQLKSELEKAGDYVVPMASVKKTEDIEKLARRIRGRLKQ